MSGMQDLREQDTGTGTGHPTPDDTDTPQGQAVRFLDLAGGIGIFDVEVALTHIATTTPPIYIAATTATTCCCIELGEL